MRLLTGDSLEKLKELPDNSVDSVVTDPPYGLSFMGKKWDYDVPSVAIWRECLRVLKPGGWLLSFAGTRTQHRMAVNIEDAGFEIRDMIAWVYGSGFPKSHNVGKAIDKLQGNEREVVGEYQHPDGKKRNINNHKPNVEVRLADHSYGYNTSGFIEQTKGNSDWEGWGTALKPALEPITVARKPLSEKSVAENVLKWGTGGINIDESRVATEEMITNHSRSAESAISKGKYGDSSEQETHQTDGQQLGRFPANLIHDGSEEVTELFPNNNPSCKSPSTAKPESKFRPGQGNYQPQGTIYPNDEGTSAARFFYCPKASKSDRDEGLDKFQEVECGMMDDDAYQWRDDVPNGRSTKKPIRKNFHPTVKPTELMKYLVRLVTQKGGTVLDPFMGSGSTGKACKLLGYDFIGIEIDPEYIEIAKARIENIGTAEEIYIEPKQKEKIHKFFEL